MFSLDKLKIDDDEKAGFKALTQRGLPEKADSVLQDGRLQRKSDAGMYDATYWDECRWSTV
jgi:hypothetical protein